MTDQNKTSFCGTIAIVGRPNVGKSTLLNCILDQRLSIVTPKKQTTRHQILGIKTMGHYQLLFLDTPGIHCQQHRQLNRMMNRVASTSMREADVIVFMVTASAWSQDDQWALESIETANKPTILCVNKVDMLASEEDLLAGIKCLKERFDFAVVTSVSAKTGDGVDLLLSSCKDHLPEGEHLFPAHAQTTDRDDEFLISEIIRERLMVSCHDELPYVLYVQVESLQKEDTIWRIHTVIWVETEGQKKMVIGRSGSMLKRVGTDARKRLEKKFSTKVFLKLWVKVKKGWPDELPEDVQERFF